MCSITHQHDAASNETRRRGPNGTGGNAPSAMVERHPVLEDMHLVRRPRHLHMLAAQAAVDAVQLGDHRVGILAGARGREIKLRHLAQCLGDVDLAGEAELSSSVAIMSSGRMPTSTSAPMSSERDG